MKVRKMKAGIISLGCCKNLVDSENLIGLLRESGIEMTTDRNEADVIIINTCGFIEPAKVEAINTILEICEYKQERDMKVVVTGCLPQRDKADLEAEIPEVDRFISIDEYKDLGPILSEVLGVPVHNNYGKATRVLSGKPWMAYLKIADGCDNKCSYCAIPLIRGPYISMPMEELVEEAKRLAESGVKELNLIAQDTTRYGIDNYGERKLLELLQKINEIEGLHWIRVLYMYPDEIDDELIEGMAKLDKVLPYFDIPIQHGNDEMLIAMNRRGTVASIRYLCDKIRAVYDMPVLRTTLITGYPNETLAMHEDNVNLLKDLKWDRMGAFSYSYEEDTPAYELEDNVEPEEKERRLAELMAVQEVIAEEKNRELIGKVLEVMVEKKDGLTGRYHGRSVLSAPDGIDGEVIFRSDDEYEGGDFVMVKINKAIKHDLLGIVIKEGQES